jgi:hypothetical protein
VQVDTQRNLVRAIALGATEMRSKNLLERRLEPARLLEIVAENLNVDREKLEITADNGSMYAVQCDSTRRALFGLVKKTTHPLRLIDDEGVIRLQKPEARALRGFVADWESRVSFLLEDFTSYGDGGISLPNLYIVAGKRIIDMTGLPSEEQIYSLGRTELSRFNPDEPLIMIAIDRDARGG